MVNSSFGDGLVKGVWGVLESNKQYALIGDGNEGKGKWLGNEGKGKWLGTARRKRRKGRKTSSSSSSSPSSSSSCPLTIELAPLPVQSLQWDG